MKHWTVQRLVTAGFLAVILLSVGICGFSVIRLGNMKNQAELLQNDAVPGLYQSNQLLMHLWQNDAELIKLIAISDPAVRTSMVAAIEHTAQENQRIMEERAKTVAPGEETKLFEDIKRCREDYIAVRTELLSLVKEDKTKEALVIYQDKEQPALKKYSDAVEKLEANDKFHSDEALTDISTQARDTNRVVWVGSLISLFVCLGVAYWVIQLLGDAMKNLMLSLIQVNGSATEMAATLKEQQASANEVASTSVEIGATAKEISATTKELGKTMSDVASVSEQTAELAAGGQTNLSRLEGTMRQIMGATASISGKLAILNEKTANINSMVTTINKVADQTNLLSLNAAIEAEKAGEYGQGFAVVATEIRRLADQTAVATYDIEQMVKEMQSAVSAGVMGMDKFAEEVRRGNEEVCGVTGQLGQIITQVQALTPRFESVNEGMQMQSTAAGQISDALTQLGDTAQQSAQALRQNSEAIEQLMKAAQGLQVAASQLKSKD